MKSNQNKLISKLLQYNLISIDDENRTIKNRYRNKKQCTYCHAKASVTTKRCSKCVCALCDRCWRNPCKLGGLHILETLKYGTNYVAYIDENMENLTIFGYDHRRVCFQFMILFNNDALDLLNRRSYDLNENELNHLKIKDAYKIRTKEIYSGINLEERTYKISYINRLYYKYEFHNKNIPLPIHQKPHVCSSRRSIPLLERFQRTSAFGKYIFEAFGRFGHGKRIKSSLLNEFEMRYIKNEELYELIEVHSDIFLIGFI
jgi:hypothetical protein